LANSLASSYPMPLEAPVMRAVWFMLAIPFQNAMKKGVP
jgi:hypothetical protein